LTRYMKKSLIAFLAGLMLLAAFALSAPAGAKLICPHGTNDPKYCKHVLVLNVRIKVDRRTSPPTVTITVTVKDPHVTITLLNKHGHLIKTIFDGDFTGTRQFTFTAPSTPGVYRVKTVATSHGITKTDQKTFVVNKPKHHNH
jgi:hypothetical protein